MPEFCITHCRTDPTPIGYSIVCFYAACLQAPEWEEGRIALCAETGLQAFNVEANTGVPGVSLVYTRSVFMGWNTTFMLVAVTAWPVPRIVVSQYIVNFCKADSLIKLHVHFLSLPCHYDKAIPPLSLLIRFKGGLSQFLPYFPHQADSIMLKASKLYPNTTQMLLFQMVIFIFVSALTLYVLVVWSGGHKSDANASSIVEPVVTFAGMSADDWWDINYSKAHVVRIQKMYGFGPVKL